MAFDQETRNRLARFVSQARGLLTDEFTRQLQHEYGLDPATGLVAPLETLTALDDARRETARILRETLTYYLAGQADTRKNRQAALDRILREQAFTVLNRLCALRMAEARGIILPAVGQGYRSQGFQLYAMLAGPALGETGEAYQTFLFSLFDELAVELPPLFDRFSPEGRLFPRPTALLDLLELMNAPELEPLWAEDETIGWVYQYFNSPEERRAMRKASQAPRNSRELAVRNQFFTPRYVVEFLTDNTLGRIWYEMTKGETSLADSCRYLVRRPNEIFLADGEEAPEIETPENLSQEELLRQPVYIPHRPLKDPRDIKMLDPACGSMHFGLYAFDLFERIYEEAWDLEARLGPEAFRRSPGLRPLRETYPDKVALRRDIPRLIIEHNIHGIDIDPRAVQIAGLSLWLRAQKSWQAQGLKPNERPQIRKSNIVCAEPMPGDRAMLEEFLATLDEGHLERLLRRVLNLPPGKRLRVTPAMAGALADLVRVIWDEMELAGEAGSLLKIEETLREAVAAAREASAEKNPLFEALDYDLGTGDLDFWDHAEELVLAALQDYAEGAANGATYRRRLFAGDAAQGFALVEMCGNRYDVALMNPPFGLVQPNVFKYLQKHYPDTYVDVYASFVERGREILQPNGLVGAITSRTFIASKKLIRWRANLIDRVTLLADLGLGVMDDAMVRSAAYVLSRQESPIISFLCIDVQSELDKEIALQAYLSKVVGHSHLFWISRKLIHNLPGQKLLYQASQTISNLFSNNPSFEPTIGTVRKGLTTFKDVRYLRAWWEVYPNEIGKKVKWERFAKGGEYAVFYTDVHLIVNRANDGAELAETNRLVNGQVAQSRQASAFYYRPGVQYTSRSALGFSARAIPADCVWSSNAPLILSQSEYSPAYILGWINSRLVRSLIELQSTADDFVPGSLKLLPWAPPDKSDADRISEIAKNLSKAYHLLECWQETDPFFRGMHLAGVNKLAALPEFDPSRRKSVIVSIQKLQKELTNIVDRVYDIDSTVLADTILERNVVDETPITPVEKRSIPKWLLGYACGLIFGRWDIRYATGERTPPPMPDPFAPLPACPPGMLQNEQGLPAAPGDVPADYPLRISWGGILVDDPGHPEDIVGRVREALAVIWGERAEAIEAEACQILGVPSLRDYFQNPNGFFADHLKRYSKSRRYAPIYWPLSTASGSYTLWLYYHRLTDQTLYTCVNDFVDPKLKQVSEDLSRLRQKRDRSRDEEAELERLTDFEAELKDFREELLRVAAFWKPDLNDGVQITAAPLWKLFRLKKWQKRLKDTWEKLEAGEYDWAHLAYSIWPERVREKCKTDKSLAIAHDLEHLYVEPPRKARKRRGRKKSGSAQGELNP